MSLPSNILITTCDIYRPFGARSPTTSGLACRLVADVARGRGFQSAANYLVWTHYLDLDSSADIRARCSRPAGSDSIAYADGDAVRVPRVSTTRHVVASVEL